MNAPNVDDMPDDQVARLLAALWPTRIESGLERTARWLWGPPFARRPDRVMWIGDRVDDLRCRLQTRRAARGRHLIARRPRP